MSIHTQDPSVAALAIASGAVCACSQLMYSVLYHRVELISILFIYHIKFLVLLWWLGATLTSSQTNVCGLELLVLGL